MFEPAPARAFIALYRRGALDHLIAAALDPPPQSLEAN
jgi:hypothetical protein